MAMLENRTTPSGELDSGYAWWRLVLTLVLGTVACVGNWSVVVLLPTLEIEFDTVRGGASLPYTGTMLGFAVGGVVMGRLADRVGIVLPVMIGAFLLCVGYVMAALTTNIWQFAALSAVIGLGSAAGFAPLISDLSHWFRKHRALAVAFAASGSYLSGAVWPLIIEHFQATHGWRSTLIGIGLFVPLVMVPTGLLLRRRLQSTTYAQAEAVTEAARCPGLSSAIWQPCYCAPPPATAGPSWQHTCECSAMHRPVVILPWPGCRFPQAVLGRAPRIPDLCSSVR